MKQALVAHISHEGPARATGPQGNGGGIWNDGTLVSTQSTITENWASHQGRGDGGGVWNHGTATITLSTINTNYGHGGGVWNNGTLTITQSTISANQAVWVGSSGGGITNSGHLSLRHSTMNGNRAGRGTNLVSTCSWDLPGGDGGAILNSGWLSMRNSTLSGNRAGDGGSNPWASPAVSSPGNGGGIANAGVAQIEYSTISANATGAPGSGWTITDPGANGGGIYNQENGRLKARGLLLAGNTALHGNDCFGDSDSPTFQPARRHRRLHADWHLTGIIIGQPAKLLPLSDNGGPTRTLALQGDSPGIDRGDCIGLDGQPLTATSAANPDRWGAGVISGRSRDGLFGTSHSSHVPATTAKRGNAWGIRRRPPRQHPARQRESPEPGAFTLPVGGAMALAGYLRSRRRQISI